MELLLSGVHMLPPKNKYAFIDEDSHKPAGANSPFPSSNTALYEPETNTR